MVDGTLNPSSSNFLLGVAVNVAMRVYVVLRRPRKGAAESRLTTLM